MGLTKNVFYSSFLTAGLYISQFITYPYVTRKLGVESLGICNFIQSYVQFFFLSSFLGISTLGVREIAKTRGDKVLLNKTFTQLFSLSAITTFISLILYFIIGFSFSQFSKYTELFLMGAFTVLINLFIIEWFYRGIEDFKYITVRTLLIRIAYVLMVFLLIKNETHYVRYYFLTMLVYVANAIFNWTYRKKYVSLALISLRSISKFIKPNLILGLQVVLLSYCVTIIPMLLGLYTNSTEVGYFTTASKLVLIILMLYNAYTLVLMPHVSSLVGKDSESSAIVLIGKSYNLLYMLSIPIIILVELYVPEIIFLAAGTGYEGAILPMRIALPVIFLGGISQITIHQVLVPFNLEKESLFASIIGIIVCIIFSCVFLPEYKSIASSFSWIFAELVIALASVLYAKKYIKDFSINIKYLVKYLVVFLPLAFLFFLKQSIESYYLQIAAVLLVFIVYYHFSMYYLIRDENYFSLMKKIVHPIRKYFD